jgi:hypothetical protein
MGRSQAVRMVRAWGGLRLEKVERTSWLGESQWSSGSAEEASRIEDRVGGSSMQNQKNSRGGEEEESIGCVCVCVCVWCGVCVSMWYVCVYVCGVCVCVVCVSVYVWCVCVWCVCVCGVCVCVCVCVCVWCVSLCV